MSIRRTLLIATALCSVALTGTAWSATIYYRTPSPAPNAAQPAPLDGAGTVGTPTTPADTTPNAFSIPALSGQAPGSTVTSAAVAISGIDSPAPIAVTGDSSAQISIAGGAYGSGGTISNGQSFTVRVVTPAAGASAQTQSATVTVGGVSATWSVGTRAADATPDGFSIPALAGQNPGSTVTSAAVAISGIEASVPIAVSGDPSAQISIAGGAYGSGGTISNGQSFTVRVVTPAAGASAQTQSITVTAGGVASTWSVGTRAADTTPDGFSIPALAGQNPGSTVTSAAVAISGIEASVPIAVSGDPSAQISIAGGAYGSGGTISNGQSFTVRVVTPAAGASAQTQSITVTAGGVASTWSVGTRAADTAPDSFSIAAVTGVAGSATGTSAAVTPTGYTDAAPIAISGDPSARISVAGGAYSASGVISPGQSFTAQMSAGVADGSTKTATVSVGGVSATWSMKVQDQIPDAYAIAALTGQTTGSAAVSAAVTPTGYDAATTISVTGDGGPGLDINSDGNFQASRTIAPGQSFRVRLTNSASGGVTSNATVTMGGITATFSATTVTAAPVSASCPGTQTYAGFGNTTIGGTSGMPGGDVVGDGGWVVFYGVDGSGNVQCIPNGCPNFTFTTNGGAQFTARYSVGNCGGTGYAPIARVYQRNGQTCYSNGGFEMCDGNAPALRGDWH